MMKLIYSWAIECHSAAIRNMFAQAQSTSVIEGLAIILSVVSLIITIVGFFASLRFYRDGITLQKSANDALTKLAAGHIS
jgi:hypothetical protein